MRRTRRVLKFKRRIRGKTDYKKRLKLLLSKKPRLVIRRSLNNIYIQITKYNPKGDKVIISSNSNELRKKYGFFTGGNIPASYLVGLIAGRKALKKGIKDVVIDMGLHSSTKGSRVYAALKGIIDAGVNVPHSNEIFPKQERIIGKHIKSKIDIEKHFNEIKEKIIGEK